MEETWKPIKGYEDYYEVSSLGRFRSLPKIVGGRWGKCQYKGKVIQTIENPAHGYGQVSLVGADGKRTHRAHRIVAEAFIENPDDKPYVNHIDCDKMNNRVENLEWVTAKENTAHLQRLGRGNPSRGEDSPSAILSAKLVKLIRKMRMEGWSMPDLAMLNGVSTSTISDIVNLRTWKHI
jgi:5,10-methylenetetrahydrofolate reductase